MHGISSIVVAEENYGGRIISGTCSPRASFSWRKSGFYANLFARIHETNLKKQGMLALTFVNKDDYNKIKEKRYFYQSKGWNLFYPDKNLTIEIIHRMEVLKVLKLLTHIIIYKSNGLKSRKRIKLSSK